jgi:ABC-type uncharacterized transport system substrate-binding protein
MWSAMHSSSHHARSLIIRSALSLLFYISTALLDSTTATVEAQVRKNILVLHSYHQGLQWTDSISAGIKSGFANDRDDIDIYFEYLDTKHYSQEAYFKHLVEFERYKTQLSHTDFKVIIVSDNNALRFMVEYGDELYPGTPVVFCGVNNYRPEMLQGKTRFTGVVENIDYAATINLMRKLHPKRRHVLVLLDKTPTGKAIKAEFEPVARKFSKHFKFEYYQDFTLAEIPKKISALGRNDIIYLLTINRDRNGRFITYAQGVRAVRKRTKVPIYGSWEFYFGKGIIGGMITSGFSQGRTAAGLARKILAGKPVERIPVITKSPNQYMFDYVPMSRFGIKVDQLPPGSTVINQPPSTFAQMKESIFAALASVLALLVFLSWRLVVQKRNQKRLYRSNIELDRRVAEQTATLEQSNSLLKKEIENRTKIEKYLRDNTDRLEKALSKVKTLSGLLPICASCKKIRDDKGYWSQIETYLNQHSDATFSHGICPDCAKRLYPDLMPKS